MIVDFIRRIGAVLLEIERDLVNLGQFKSSDREVKALSDQQLRQLRKLHRQYGPSGQPRSVCRPQA